MIFIIPARIGLVAIYAQPHVALPYPSFDVLIADLAKTCQTCPFWDP